MVPDPPLAGRLYAARIFAGEYPIGAEIRGDIAGDWKTMNKGLAVHEVGVSGIPVELCSAAAGIAWNENSMVAAMNTARASESLPDFIIRLPPE